MFYTLSLCFWYFVYLFFFFTTLNNIRSLVDNPLVDHRPHEQLYYVLLSLFDDIYPILRSLVSNSAIERVNSNTISVKLTIHF